MENDNAPHLPARPHRAAALALIALAFFAAAVIYLPTITGGLLADDFWYMDQAQTVKFSEHPLLSMRKGNFYYLRPLPSLAWSVYYDMFGLSHAPYRLSSLALHLLVVLSVFRLCRRATGSEMAAGLGAICFAAHPLHAEAVAWVSSNADLMAALFATLSLERYLAWRSGEGDHGPLAACLVLGLLAALSKESAYVLPGIMALAEILPGANRKGKHRALAVAGAFIAVMVLFGVKTFLAAGQLRPPTGATPLTWLPANAGMALLRFAAPAAREGAKAVYVNYSLMAVLGAGLAAAILTRRFNRPAVLGAVFLVAALVPPAAVARLGPHLEFSRTLYLPSVGYALLVSGLYAGLLRGPVGKWRGSVPTALIAALAALLFFAAGLNVRLWASAGRASNDLMNSFSQAAGEFQPGQSAIVERVPVTMAGVPFHSNSYTLSVAFSISVYPGLFTERGYDDRNTLPFYAVSAETPEIEARMTPVKKLRLLKSGKEGFDYRMVWDSRWALPE